MLIFNGDKEDAHESTIISWASSVVKSRAWRERRAVEGPERDLVEGFLSQTKTKVASNQRLSVFVEVSLESTYPDIVAVVWNKELEKYNNEHRQFLQRLDIQILHVISTEGTVTFDFLFTFYGFKLQASLNRLQKANLICVEKDTIKTLNHTFFVDHIIAIEAKVSATQRVLEQSCLNTWFCSESYVLVPKKDFSPLFVSTAKKFNVGILGFDGTDYQKMFEPKRKELPLSYGSWLYNERLCTYLRENCVP